MEGRHAGGLWCTDRCYRCVRVRNLQGKDQTNNAVAPDLFSYKVFVAQVFTRAAFTKGSARTVASYENSTAHCEWWGARRGSQARGRNRVQKHCAIFTQHSVEDRPGITVALIRPAWVSIDPHCGCIWCAGKKASGRKTRRKRRAPDLLAVRTL